MKLFFERVAEVVPYENTEIVYVGDRIDNAGSSGLDSKARQSGAQLITWETTGRRPLHSDRFEKGRRVCPEGESGEHDEGPGQEFP
ncbi:hypothetical protein [Streptomyces sp. NPDC007100]|uniref:hypothetical protein n=1 Tax=Streptomyces sp. NPDC007100 TaxID=3155602 RepID=UPI0033CA3023